MWKALKKAWPIAVAIVVISPFVIANQVPDLGLIRIEASDPTAGAGFPGLPNEFLIRTDTLGLYYKSGPGNTQWTAIAGAAGGNVTGGGTGTVNHVVRWTSASAIGDNAAVTESTGDSTLATPYYAKLTGGTFADPPYSGTNPPLFSGILGQTVAPGSITCSGAGCGETSPFTCGVRGVKSTPSTGWNNLPVGDYGACFDDTITNGTARVRTSVVTPLIETQTGALTITPNGANPVNITTSAAVTGQLTADGGLRVFDVAGTGLSSSGNTINGNTAGLGFFGDGSSGAVTWNAGTTTLTADIYATSITCADGAIVNTAGFHVDVQGTFTGPATNSSGGCILRHNGTNGTQGIIGVGGATGGAGAGGSVGLPNGTTGGAGQFGGGGGNGVNPTWPTNYRAGLGGAGGTDGAGHNGGNGGTASAIAATNGSMNRLWTLLNGYWHNATGGITTVTGGAGGGGGGGTAVGTGIGGGGGGGGGYQSVTARQFVNASNITIQANGGNGANGVCSGGNAGGGGGGGGGYTIVACGTGSAPNVQANGGTHGNGCGATGVNGNDGNVGKTNTGYCPLGL